MKAKLYEPKNDKRWSLQFFDVPQEDQTIVKYTCLQIGQRFHVEPFVQGDSDNWIMIEYWCNAQEYILDAAMNSCSALGIELEL